MSTTCWGSHVHAADGRKPVALLARAGAARDRLREALDAAGALVVLEEDPAAIDAATLAAAAPQAALVALEPAVEDALVALEPALEAPGLLVIFDEADLAARRDGWEAQRWIRHLAAKLHGHADVLPPGCEQDMLIDLQPGHPATPQQLHAEAPFETHLVEAVALAAELPQDRPGEPLPELATSTSTGHDWELTHGAHAAAGRTAPESKPLPDFSRLELVAIAEESADAVVRGAVLVIAGIGGPDAVRKLMTALPSGFSRPLLVQLKLDGGRYDNLVKQLARVSALPVAMAMPGDAIAAGTVYVLPERVGVEAKEDGMVFIDGGGEPVAALPPAESAVIVLSGAEPSRIDAVLALATRGGHVAGQALEGCYDATAVKLMAAGGAELGTPAQLAEQLGARWP
ncbi:chemotaxis protein CheB [Pseudoxanthomonas daejeonensis]|uniref:Chemotaxis protein n=1 Tax=Pseudoxanthomonas daejeonensis TaxID=266062 RepID=A0ABQ6ZAB8_9GAMM|nr:chemotaxis protein CheB [Pseudoxanthomonas daejeonensis]KAF1696813.1 chemotaxis protein [Pseudoxanthomonas daejeonensis]